METSSIGSTPSPAQLIETKRNHFRAGLIDFTAGSLGIFLKCVKILL